MTTSNLAIFDSVGNQVAIGDKVIYNLSGELAIGIVMRAVITNTRKITWAPYFRHDYLIEIQHIKGGGYNTPNMGISKVRNPKSMIVLKGIENE